MRATDYLDAGWKTAPDSALMVETETGQSVSYDDVVRFTHRFAHALAAKGYDSSTHVAVLSHNSIAMYKVTLGILRSDAVWLPLNFRSGKSELVELLRTFDVNLLFYERAFIGTVDELRAQDVEIDEYVELTDEAIESWIGDQPDGAFEADADLDTLMAIKPTGGTTGLPKAVLIPNRTLKYIVDSFTIVAPFRASDRSPRPVYLAAAPLTHASGEVMQYVMKQGGTGVIMGASRPGDILAAIEEYGVTHLFLPPTVIYGMIDDPDAGKHDYSTLQYMMYGAAPMAPAKLAAAVALFGPVLAQIYGQTETAVPNLYLAPEDHFIDGDPARGVAGAERLGAVGKPTPLAEVVIMDEDGVEVPVGVAGEICVRGPGVTPGYYKNPAATAKAKRAGFHRTGDIAYRDADDYFHIVDRKDDIIITGGFNVYSAEVERVILTHPDVQECAVFGVPDSKWGESVTAVVEPLPGRTVDPEEVRARCHESLGGVKTPKQVIVMQALPRTNTGKVLKRELRDEYWKDRKRRVS